MTAGGTGMRRRVGTLAALSVAVAVGAGMAAAARPVAAQLCVGTCSSTSATPTPLISGSIINLRLPPCLICVSPPLPLPVCGVTADCQAALAPSSPPSSPSGSGGGGGEARGSASSPRLPTPPPSPTSVGTVIPSTGNAAGSGDVEAGLSLMPPTIAALSPASGLSFGGGLRIWPVLLVLDGMALGVLVTVLRRTWSRAPAV